MRPLFLLALALVAGCTAVREAGRLPALSPTVAAPETRALTAGALPSLPAEPIPAVAAASTWAGGPGSLLDPPRARAPGDIVTVVIEIDDSATIESDARRARTEGRTMGIDGLLGIPQRIDEGLPDGASLGSAVDVASAADFAGSGSVRRSESLAVRVAAVVLSITPNGALAIRGTQEVRVNAELRELLVTGFVRPEDINRRNEIGYDRIASARISYGGRGRVSEFQQPSAGGQVLDRVLPF